MEWGIGGRLKREGIYIYIYVYTHNYDWLTLVYSRDHHNIVKQLSSKNKSQLKSCHGHLQRHHHTKSILYCRSHLQRNDKDHFKFYCSVDEAQIFHWLCYLFSKHWFFSGSEIEFITCDLWFNPTGQPKWLLIFTFSRWIQFLMTNYSYKSVFFNLKN